MDALKKITPEHFEQVRADCPFNKVLLMKDYHITILLYLMKDIEGIYFKGGTALGKIVLNYHRMSEDIDFTLTKDLELVKKDIINAIEKSGFFDKITKDKDVHGFTPTYCSL